MTEQDEVLYNQQKEWEREQEFYASESAKAMADIKAKEEGEMGMAEQLREKIAIEGAATCFELWKRLSDEQKGNWRQWAKNRILPIIKEALPKLAREAGYVKLVVAPLFPRFTKNHKYQELITHVEKIYAEKMYDEGWRKTEQEEKMPEQELAKRISLKPDEKLLTKEERDKAIDEGKWNTLGELLDVVTTAQDAKTASIKDAEYQQDIKEITSRMVNICQSRVERIKKELEEPCPHKTYPLELRSKQYCELCWQEFWEGINGS